MSELAVIITSTTQPGRRDDVFAMYEDHLAPRAVDNEDQLVVVWTDDQADADTFHLFELYANVDAFQANASAPFFAEYMAAAGPLLAAQPTIRMATPRWSTGL